MKITRAGANPSRPAPEEYFTGAVRMDRLFSENPPGRLVGLLVTFEPGARTAWHTHPFGQTLIVTQGLGRCRREGGPVEEIRPGDIVQFDAGERHWHGASPEVAMTHIALQEADGGKTADWMEKVEAADYNG